MNHLRILICLALLSATACNSAPQLDDFDADAWRSDVLGCQGKRLEQVTALIEQKDKLIGKSQHDIMALLGTPDEHELYERTRKFFFYHLDPAAACADSSTDNSTGRDLSLRFNALDMCSEVIIRY